jgi:hypothetical protein
VEFLEGSAGEEVLEADGPAGRLAHNRLLDPVLEDGVREKLHAKNTNNNSPWYAGG